MKMKYGHNGKTQIEPFKGGKEQCQICGGSMTAHCGDIRRHHWHHDSSCDSWYEPMTDWHIDWQNRFPEDWREVVRIKNQEKHVADVFTDKDIVIEFQHSFIPTDEIREREAFYENMIWVLDAREFSGRLIITSDVNTKKRELDKEKRNDLRNAELSITQNIYNQIDNIRKIKQSIENNKSQIHILSSEISKLLDIKNNESNYIEKNIIESWLSEKQNYSAFNPLNQLLREIEPEFKAQIQSVSSTISTLDNNLQRKSALLKRVNNRPDVVIIDKTLKLIDYEKINTDNYHKVFAIEKKNKDTLFDNQREVIQFKNESDIELFQFKKENYEFGYDARELIERLTSEISDLENSLDSSKQKLRTLKINIKERLNEYIEQKTKQLKFEKTEIEDKIIESKNSLQNAELALEKLKQNKDKDLAELLESIEIEYKQSRGFVLKKHKGNYSFTWKNERKSWRTAECQLFFDIGKGYLFERISTNQLKKISIDEFLRFHLKTPISA